MELIHGELMAATAAKPRISLDADRMTLAKRRWRGVAQDGREFGFDLPHPLTDGAAFFETDECLYIVVQQPETLFEIKPGAPHEAARIGWMIGNLHFPIEIDGDILRVPEDAAVRQLFEREHIHFHTVRKIFRPLKVVSSHHAH